MIPEPTEPGKLRISMGRKTLDFDLLNPDLRGQGLQLHRLEVLREFATIAEKEGGYSTVLRGDSSLTRDGYQLQVGPLKESLAHQHVNLLFPFHTVWNTVTLEELQRLKEDSPHDRYKFYLSLDLRSKEKEQQALAFLHEVIAACRTQHIPLTSKSFDHTYDSCNLYTWQPTKLAKILQDLYPKYPDIWLTTPHFFQGQIPKVNSDHIGWVQEPVSNETSHSTRMGKLGTVIDEGATNGQPLNLELYRQATEAAGVDATYPWLIKKKST